MIHVEVLHTAHVEPGRGFEVNFWRRVVKDGSFVQVFFRGESFVDVTVQDTGLLPANHVDLSEAAFSQLGLLPEGRISVLIEVLNGAG